MKIINNNSLNMNNVGESIEVYGFVANRRKMGELTFIDLRDRTGVVQIVLKNNKYQITKESVLRVEGKVIERKDKNHDLPSGQIEIEVSNIEVLSKSKNELPFTIRDDSDVNENTRLTHRYLDLRRPKMQKIFKTRHRVIKSIRDFLDQKEFLEIETPILSKSTPEGARDFLVPTRNAGHFYALPQSPQIYKQLLMISGFEKYFQISRVFRDEDSRKDRQPEFTQLDIELSYGDEAYIKSLMENMFKHIFKNLGINITIPFMEMEYDKAIDEYGSDKPDLRYGNKLVDVTKYFKESDFNVFKSASNIKMISIPDFVSNKQQKFLEQVAIKNGAKGLFWASYNKNDDIKKGPGFKFVQKEIDEITKDLNIEEGTLFFVAGDYNISTKALGAVRVEVADLFRYAKDEYNFVWIVNWPLFEKDSEKDRFIAAHHPFTSPSKDTISTFDSDKVNARARAYDLVLNGFEIGGGSIRIFDPEIQSRMFGAIGMSKEEIQSQFGFFLEAFKYGTPPHLGIAFGIDRIIMILEKTNSIRDVIAFPKNSHGIAVMEGAPSIVSKVQMDEYNIKLKE